MITKNKLLIDKNCPMCTIYGYCFTKLKMVDQNTVNSYQEVDQQIFDQIDEERAKSEIALVNTETGKTIYGIDAFLHIFSGKSAFLKWFFQLPFIHFLANKIYRFTSFNRHVIAGGRHVHYDRDCTPEIHKGYRWSYILITALLTGLILNQFTYLLDSELGLAHPQWREFAVCAGQIGWQFGAISIIQPTKRLDYLGNMSTVSLIGGLLLLPLLIFQTQLHMSIPFLLLYFALVVFVMLVMHIRRCKHLGLPIDMTLSWILYRGLILIAILTPLLF